MLTHQYSCELLVLGKLVVSGCNLFLITSICIVINPAVSCAFSFFRCVDKFSSKVQFHGLNSLNSFQGCLRASLLILPLGFASTCAISPYFWSVWMWASCCKFPCTLRPFTPRIEMAGSQVNTFEFMTPWCLSYSPLITSLIISHSFYFPLLRTLVFLPSYLAAL